MWQLATLYYARPVLYHFYFLYGKLRNSSTKTAVSQFSRLEKKNVEKKRLNKIVINHWKKAKSRKNALQSKTHSLKNMQNLGFRFLF